MKKIYSIALAAVAILSAASCQKELVNDNFDAAGEKFTVTAVASADSKTVLDGVNTYWTPGDQIVVYDATGAEVTFSTAITEQAATAKFTADAEFVAPESLVAVYPKRTDRGATSFADGVITGLHVGGGQTAVAGSFEPKFAVSVGTPKAEGSTELVFTAAHSLVKFTVGGEAAPTTVTLKNNGMRAIAGMFDYNTADGAITMTAGNPFIDVTGNFEVGKTYYIVMTSGVCGNGISLLYDGVEMKNTGETFTAEPNKIYNLGTLPAPAEEPGEAAVVLNELCGNKVYNDNKFIELYNAGTAEADLAGWTLRKYAADAIDVAGKYDVVWTAPEGTKIAAGEYLVLASDQTDPALGFDAGLSAKKGLKIELVDPQGNVVDKFVRGEDTDPFGEEKLEENTEASFSRVPNGTGDWAYAVPTPGAANGEKTGDIEGYVAFEPETPADVWAGENVVSYDLPESASSSRQVLRNIKFYADRDNINIRLVASISKIAEVPTDGLTISLYDKTTGTAGKGFYGWWNGAIGDVEYNAERCGTIDGEELTMTVEGNPVAVEKVKDGDLVTWTFAFPRSANPVLANSKVYMGVLSLDAEWNATGAMPDKYAEMFEVVLP